MLLKSYGVNSQQLFFQKFLTLAHTSRWEQTLSDLDTYLQNLIQEVWNIEKKMIFRKGVC
jgi:hypothetical protein